MINIVPLIRALNVNNNDKNFTMNTIQINPESLEAIRSHLNFNNNPNDNRLTIYSDQFVAKIAGGPEFAQKLANEHEFIFLGQVSSCSFDLLLFPF